MDKKNEHSSGTIYPLYDETVTARQVVKVVTWSRGWGSRKVTVLHFTPWTPSTPPFQFNIFLWNYFFAKFLTRLLYNDGIIPHWIKIIRMLLFLFCSLRRKKEAEDRKKIQLFKEFLNNIQSEYAMIYLTLICLNLNFTFWVKIYVLTKGYPSKEKSVILGECLYLKPVFRQCSDNPKFLSQGFLKFVRIPYVQTLTFSQKVVFFQIHYFVSFVLLTRYTKVRITRSKIRTLPARLSLFPVTLFFVIEKIAVYQTKIRNPKTRRSLFSVPVVLLIKVSECSAGTSNIILYYIANVTDWYQTRNPSCKRVR